MHSFSYITSNPDKAKHMSRLLGFPISEIATEIPEIQSLNLHEVIEHKTKTAYELVKKPLFVDDVSLVITQMKGLPGPFIKYFISSLGTEKICRMVDLFPSREAVAQAMIGYHNGKNMHFFLGEVKGIISEHPSGHRGFGWDEIFIPDGYTQIRAEMNEEDYDTTSPRKVALDKLKKFLHSQ